GCPVYGGDADSIERSRIDQRISFRMDRFLKGIHRLSRNIAIHGLDNAVILDVRGHDDDVAPAFQLDVAMNVTLRGHRHRITLIALGRLGSAGNLSKHILASLDGNALARDDRAANLACSEEIDRAIG